MNKIRWNYLDNPLYERNLDDSYYEYIRSPAWKCKRDSRLTMDNYTCQLCGSHSNLVIHHLTYKNFGDEELNDLITLCSTCHSYVHERRDERLKEYFDLEIALKQKGLNPIYQNARYVSDETIQKKKRLLVFIETYENKDIALGGSMNICRIDTIRLLWHKLFKDADAPVQQIQGYIGRCRRVEIWNFRASGYPTNIILKLTGLSEQFVYKFFHNMFSKKWLNKERSENYMKHVDLTNVQESGDFNRLPAGGYICKYTNVEDKPDKEYLYMEYDIAEGEYKDYYKGLAERANFWGGRCYRSYKPAALPMFKRMCSAVSKSNGSFVFDGGTVNDNEKTLIGKYVGLVFGEEEYVGNDGNKKTRLYVSAEKSVQDIRDGNFKVPKLKPLKDEDDDTSNATIPDEFVNVADSVTDEEIPFN